MTDRPYTIAFVGRPNVGKSSLMNALLGYRRAIVLDMPGTTRDEVNELARWSTKPLQLTDMQGIWDEGDRGALMHALERANACLFVVDASAGPTPFDRWVAEILREKGLPVLLVANKSDTRGASAGSDFASLGFGVALDVSAAHRRNVDEMRLWCLQIAGSEEKEKDRGKKPADAPLSVALIGRPNAGKSTLMNRLCGDSVSRVSPEPLTTRDPVSYELKTPLGLVRLVDTAGMRRPRTTKEQLEIYSIHATTRAIHAADVVLLLLDASTGVTDQDMRLLGLVEREGKPVALLLNFWDKLSTADRKKFVENSDFASLLESHKRLPISALKGLGVEQIFPLAFRLSKLSNRRVRTAKLNRFVEQLVIKNPPPTRGRANFNILYASQVQVDPPTFVFFMNRKEALQPAYQKYVENSLRKYLGMAGQTIRVHFRGNGGR